MLVFARICDVANEFVTFLIFLIATFISTKGDTSYGASGNISTGSVGSGSQVGHGNEYNSQSGIKYLLP